MWWSSIRGPTERDGSGTVVRHDGAVPHRAGGGLHGADAGGAADRRWSWRSAGSGTWCCAGSTMNRAACANCSRRCRRAGWAGRRSQSIDGELERRVAAAATGVRAVVRVAAPVPRRRVARAARGDDAPDAGPVAGEAGPRLGEDDDLHGTTRPGVPLPRRGRVPAGGCHEEAGLLLAASLRAAGAGDDGAHPIRPAGAVRARAVH